jgi:hypothetical protein
MSKASTGLRIKGVGGKIQVDEDNKLVGEIVDAKCAPSTKHTASRTSWLHTRKESRDVPANFS